MERENVATNWEVDPATLSHYVAFFYHLNPSGSPLAGPRARNFFLCSGLTPAVLRQIWHVADTDGDGQLNTAEFAVAMHLVRLALEGVLPPPTLPAPLAECVRVLSAGVLPVMEDRHVLKCQTAFIAFKACIATGTLGLEATKYLFSKTNLSRGQLYQIWRLSDQDRDRRLIFQEFVVAMHLIFLSKLGCHILPLSIDHTSLLPPLYHEIVTDAKATVTETPPPLKPVISTSDLFPPPDVPMGDVPNDCGFNVSFSQDILRSLAPEEDQVLYRQNPFQYELSTADELAGRGLVANGDEEVVMGTERVQEEAVMLEQPAIVLEAARFTSVVSPPVEHLMMAEQVIVPTELVEEGGEEEEEEEEEEGGEEEEEEEGGGGEEEGGEEVEEEWEDGVVEEQLIIEEEDMEEEEEAGESGETEDQVHAELESLSLASRQFLKESRERLWDQQRRNLEACHPNTLGIDTYRQARFQTGNIKGLSDAIEEMNGGGGPETEWNETCPRGYHWAEGEGSVSGGECEGGVSGEEGEGGVNGGVCEGGVCEGEGEGLGDSIDILAHLDDIEAEIERTLESTWSEEEEEEGREEGREEEREGGRERGGMVSTASSSVGGSTTDLSSSSDRGGGWSPHQRDQLHCATEIVDHSPPSASVTEQLTPLPRSRKAHRSKEEQKLVMMDLDSFLQNEIESINDMVQEFETQDQQHERRTRYEEEKILTKDVTDVVIEEPKVTGLEEVAERRDREGEEAERLYQEEMKRLEKQKLQALEEESAMKIKTLESDQTIQNLTKEWDNLLIKEEQLVKDSQKEKVLREKREEEEQRQREQELREKAAEKEMTMEEWIAWMEEKKKKGMTTEQQLELERRKKVWLEREREREERRKREEEEKMRKTRERMERDYREFQERDKEVKESRLSSAELEKLQEEQARKREEERKAREEKTKRKVETRMPMGEVKPKPRSALAAKWEEKVRSQN